MGKNILTAAVCGFSLLCTAAFGQESKRTKSPNLLYIFADQYRLNALSLWSKPEYRHLINTVGDPVHTPNLDRFATQSVVFTQACSTAPLSSPHRAMLITGMYPEKNGVDSNCYKGRPQGVHEDIVCFTDVLANAGYETAYIGKTHWQRNEPYFDRNGNYAGSTNEPGGYYAFNFDTYIPEGRGRKSNKFWFQHLMKGGHFDAVAFSNRPELVNGKKDGEACPIHRFTPEVEADVVIKYLQNRNGERDASKPFSIFWAINPPHPPYSKVNDCKEDIFNKYYRGLNPDEVLLRPNVNARCRENSKFKNLDSLSFVAKIYFSLIKSVDDEIGRVLEVLEEIGQVDNTIVVFAADHGEMMGSHGLMQKSVAYEEALMIPFILRYPNKLRPQFNTSLMFGAVDIMPTLLGLLGLADDIPATVMGTDYSEGILTGNYGKKGKPVSSFYYMKKEKGVRTAKYTYVVRKEDYLLFDRTSDPYQQHAIRLEDISEKDACLLKSELGKWLNVSQDRWAKEKRYPELITY